MIFRAARALNRALAGQRVVGFETGYALLARVDDDAPLIGRVVEKVRAKAEFAWRGRDGAFALDLLRHRGIWEKAEPAKALAERVCSSQGFELYASG